MSELNFDELTFGGWKPDEETVTKAIKRLSFSTDPTFVQQLTRGGNSIDHVSVWYKVDVMNEEVPDHEVIIMDYGIHEQRDERPQRTIYRYDDDGRLVQEITAPITKDYKTPMRFFYVIVGIKIGDRIRYNIGSCDLSDTGYGDPYSNAFAQAYKRAAAMFGLGLDLYFKDNEPRYKSFKKEIKKVIGALRKGFLNGDLAREAYLELKHGNMTWARAKGLLKEAIKNINQKEAA